MRKLKVYKGWGIYQNNPIEIEEYGFNITVLHPNNMDYSYLCGPSDSDMEMDSVAAAIDWIDNYKIERNDCMKTLTSKKELTSKQCYKRLLQYTSNTGWDGDELEWWCDVDTDTDYTMKARNPVTGITRKFIIKKSNGNIHTIDV